MFNLLSVKWMPNPPALQRAVEAGHVRVCDGPHGRAYVLSPQCPNPSQVKSAIALRNTLEIAWVGVVGLCAAVVLIWLVDSLNIFL